MKKNKRFQSYTRQFSRSIVINEMKKVTSNKQLQVKARNVNPEFFNTFSFVTIDQVHREDAPLTRSLLRDCVDTFNQLLQEQDDDELPPLQDNLRRPPSLEQEKTDDDSDTEPPRHGLSDPVLLKPRQGSARNRDLISVVCMSIDVSEVPVFTRDLHGET